MPKRYQQPTVDVVPLAPLASVAMKPTAGDRGRLASQHAAGAAVDAQQRPSEYFFCTYFDRNYLAHGLALHESLVRSCRRPFRLWVLCFDGETHRILSQMELPHVRLLSRQEFEASDPQAAATQKSRSAVEYYWTCTPCLPLHVLRCEPEAEVVTYLDADLFFWSDPASLYEELSNGSVLAAEHRFPPGQAEHLGTCGRFNVGFLAFRRDAEGQACLRWWRDRCIEWCFDRIEDGKFGDQKYLDEWPGLFPGTCVLQHKGGGLAPWNLAGYEVKELRGQISVDGQPLIFYHFHGVRQVGRHFFKPMHQLYAGSFDARQMRAIYLHYWAALQAARRKVIRAGHDCRIAAGDMDGRQSLVKSLLEQQLMLAWPWWLSSAIWSGGAWRRRRKQRKAQRREDGLRLRREGFALYAAGDLRGARRSLLAALACGGIAVTNRTVISVLLEAVAGSGLMRHVRFMLGRMPLRRGR